MNPQTVGLSELEGTYLFDVQTSNRVLKLNRFFWQMIRADYRDRYRDDPEGVMEEAGLTDSEKDLVRNENWIGLVRHGANFFVVEKFARVVKKTNLQVYAMMRGETFDEFMKTRRVPDCR
ncbi:protocatechuate 3,4-dioxygenase [Paraburkholderia tuberum]|uniref:Protocatechuate 4,5-dioxygenase alpha subunit n=1 Tax=Paraburkholderia tuberum TaxID=157910 RepID=A0A1H1KFZ8_9BURK|nr:protocatechuate 3,4-dioxygenase [Paraburkholderia tuberum]SDR60900.1 protocatechuate 4,5-dioxygenase alpha subunit [Paraburkholderia tuberum]